MLAKRSLVRPFTGADAQVEARDVQRRSAECGPREDRSRLLVSSKPENKATAQGKTKSGSFYHGRLSGLCSLAEPGMKIAHKLILGSTVLVSLLWVVGWYSVSVGRQSLQTAIEQASKQLAVAGINAVDSAVCAHIDNWREYWAGSLAQRFLRESNQRFATLPDARHVIDSSKTAIGKQRPRVMSFLSCRLFWITSYLGNSEGNWPPAGDIRAMTFTEKYS